MSVLNNNKRTPPHQGTENSRLKPFRLLFIVFPAALILAACPPPGGDTSPTDQNGGTTSPEGRGTITPPPGGTTSPAFTTTVTGTVRDSSGTALTGASISVLTEPPRPENENRPADSKPDGSFTLQVKHTGTLTFRLKAEHTCYEPFTTPRITITPSPPGSRQVDPISLTPKPEPTGARRYTFTPKGPPADKKFKLTLNCVREIGLYEFNAFSGTVITTKATEEGITALNDRLNMITEISLPPTLTRIGDHGLSRNYGLQGTLMIPRNVQIVKQNGLSSIGNPFAPASPAPVVAFETGSKLREIGVDGFKDSALKDFTFPDNLETIESGAFFRARFSFSPEFPSPGTLIIPAKVSKIGNGAFKFLQGGITTLDIRSTQLAKPTGAAPSAYPLQRTLIQDAVGITAVKLPADVYDSYTPDERTAIFGSIPLTPVP